jgi:hypothetical protein
MDALIRIIKLIWIITNPHSKGLERSRRDMGAKKKKFDFLLGFWHSK